jgi:hypothetical protein
MITREVIDTLYKKYQNAPKPADHVDMALLLDSANSQHRLSINDDDAQLTIGSLDVRSPFYKIATHCILGVVPFDCWVAIVMHSSILFLSRLNSDVNVHLKPVRVPLYQKICRFCAL